MTEKVVRNTSEISHVTPNLIHEVIAFVIEWVLEYFGSVLIADAGPTLQELFNAFIAHHPDGAIRFGFNRK